MSKTPRFENVFILSTGRCGSQGFARACDLITNYSSGHETRSSLLGDERLNYPRFHIESDNRLSWFLGRVDERFGTDAFYVHLIRDRNETSESYNKRWDNSVSIMKAYANGILMKQANGLLDCLDYYDTVNSNIRHFLKDKPYQMTITMTELKEMFPAFCDSINADCDIHDALAVWDRKHNASRLTSAVTPTQRLKRTVHKLARFASSLPSHYRQS